METSQKMALVVPLYNEALRWDSKYWEKIKKSGVSLYFVDDASIDSTPSLVRLLDGVVLMNLKENVGKAEAVRLGMCLVSNPKNGFDCIGFLDADCAFNASEVVDVIQSASKYFSLGYDAIWTSRVKLLGRKINRRISRHLVGRVISTFLSIGSKEFPYDSQSGFKIYKSSRYLHDSLKYKSKTRWFFELEHFINYSLITKQPLNIWELPISEWQDVPGSKLYNIKTLRVLRELIYIYRGLQGLKRR